VFEVCGFVETRSQVGLVLRRSREILVIFVVNIY
jgi:hypothetical protein